jgi:putative flippase GtrA
LHPWGKWLAIKRTWLTVVVGVGVDLALLLMVLDIHTWSIVAAVIAASSVGIIVRSLYNEHADDAN